MEDISLYCMPRISTEISIGKEYKIVDNYKDNLKLSAK